MVSLNFTFQTSNFLIFCYSKIFFLKLVFILILSSKIDDEDEVFVHLFDKDSQKYPKYTIYLLDTSQNSNRTRLIGKFAAFVVPIGK